MKKIQRIFSLLLCFVIVFSAALFPTVAYADLVDAADYGSETLGNWLSGANNKPLGGWNPVGYLGPAS